MKYIASKCIIPPLTRSNSNIIESLKRNDSSL